MDDAFVTEKPRETPFWHNLLVSLKIGTCLTSSWVASAAAVLASTHSLDTPGKLLFGGISVGLGLILTKQSLSLNPVPPGRPPTPVEERLNAMFDQMADDFGVKARVHFLDQSAIKGNWIGQQWGENIFINQQKYDELEKREAFFPILHEFVHVYKKDHRTILLGEISNKISLVSIPVAAISATVGHIAGQSPLAAAFAGAIGVVGAGVFHTASRVFNNIANRIREGRADDIDLVMTHDPISAISAIDKLLVHEDRNFIQRLTAASPSREERILNVVEYFNSRWPERAITVHGGKIAGKDEKAPSGATVVLDASNIDQHRYVIHKDGISTVPIPV